MPPAHPRTKPKACNYGLAFATGDIVTIYDAEDAPDPLQLRRVGIRKPILILGYTPPEEAEKLPECRKLLEEAMAEYESGKAEKSEKKSDDNKKKSKKKSKK